MTRILKFIVAVKDYDRKLRKEEEKNTDPFGSKNNEKVKIPKKLLPADRRRAKRSTWSSKKKGSTKKR